MKQPASIIHQLRMIVGFALVGAVTVGALFGWIPALGVTHAEALGAVLAGTVGLLANVRQRF
jgi:hypothetical protein